MLINVDHEKERLLGMLTILTQIELHSVMVATDPQEKTKKYIDDLEWLYKAEVDLMRAELLNKGNARELVITMP